MLHGWRRRHSPSVPVSTAYLTAVDDGGSDAHMFVLAVWDLTFCDFECTDQGNTSSSRWRMATACTPLAALARTGSTTNGSYGRRGNWPWPVGRCCVRSATHSILNHLS